MLVNKEFTRIGDEKKRQRKERKTILKFHLKKTTIFSIAHIHACLLPTSRAVCTPNTWTLRRVGGGGRQEIEVILEIRDRGL